MTILDDIFDYKRAELAEQKRTQFLADIQAEARRAAPPRDFVAALRRSPTRPALIAEVKRASPSKGLLRPNLDAARLAATYAANGAAAISVLTDGEFFQGGLEDLVRVVSAVRDAPFAVPVLRKDFVFDPYQVYEARAAGADAILLIAAMLSDEDLRSLYRLTRALGMAALVEVHDQVELARSLEIEPRLVGVNNRDLRTFEVDLETTARLRPLVPRQIALVAESGVHSRADVERLVAIGADAVLVGETLVRAGDVGEKVRELIGVSG